MDDDRLEHLLRGYRLPEVPHALDRRVLDEAEAILARGRARAAIAGVARELGNALGFGYVNVLIDLVSANDAEYRVDVI